MKNLRFITSSLLVAFMSMTMSCSKSNDTPAIDGSVYKINITSTGFDPATLTMEATKKVAWTNTDVADHSVVSDDGTSFNSGIISPGGTYTFTTVTTGTYAYHCGIHPAVKGIIYSVSR